MFEELKSLLNDYTDCDVELTTDLRLDLGLSSFDLVSIIAEVEEKYNVKFEEEDFTNIITVEDIIKFIESKK